MKPFLTGVAMFKLLIMIIKYSDNENSGDFRVDRTIKLFKSDGGV